MSQQSTSKTTVGGYLAARLAEVGVRHFFTVPGDYNLILLDEILKQPGLEMISCCNELNAGYAADGYARATGGLSVAVVTYSVGGLSLINAVAGAYAEDLPMVAVSGAPNTNSAAEYELLHHTLGNINYDYQREIYARVTSKALAISHPSEAPRLIDEAIESAIQTRKPVYLEVACNIASSPISVPQPRMFGVPSSDPDALASAVQHVAERLNHASKPVLVAGVKLRSSGSEQAFAHLASASAYAVGVMPNAKSFFDEESTNYIGTYWGPVGTPGCGEVIESSDLCLFAGPVLSDYTTTGHTAFVAPEKMIRVGPDCVVTPQQTFSGVRMSDFLTALAEVIQPNDGSMVAYRRIAESTPALPAGSAEDAITTRQLYSRIERMLDSNTAVIAETGDSWFNGMRLRMPQKSRFEIQMQYGSIGWSVGATLGYCLGQGDRRVIACIGDGSFQLTAQEVSTMIRYGVSPVIFLINNGGYTIEVEIHDGPYNTIMNWDYAKLLEVFGESSDGSRPLGIQVRTEGQLDDAIQQVEQHVGLALVEVLIDRDDCSRDLLEWGGHVARNNGRPARFD